MSQGQTRTASKPGRTLRPVSQAPSRLRALMNMAVITATMPNAQPCLLPDLMKRRPPRQRAPTATFQNEPQRRNLTFRVSPYCSKTRTSQRFRSATPRYMTAKTIKEIDTGFQWKNDLLVIGVASPNAKVNDRCPAARSCYANRGP